MWNHVIIRLAVTASFFFMVVGTVTGAQAQVCPGTGGGTIERVALRVASPATATAFVGSGCAHTAVGVPASAGPSACSVNLNATRHLFVARWPSLVGRLAAGPDTGCRFVCPGGTCFVRATDGLPVELLQFGVE